MNKKNFDRMQKILAYAVDIHAEAVVQDKGEDAWLTYKNFEEKFKIKENEKKDFYHQFKAVQVSYFKTEGPKKHEKHKVNDDGIVFYYRGGFDIEKRRRKREKRQVFASVASAIAAALSVVVAVVTASIAFQQKNSNELIQERQSELKEQMVFLKQRTNALEDSIESISVTLTSSRPLSINVKDTLNK